MSLDAHRGCDDVRHRDRVGRKKPPRSRCATRTDTSLTARCVSLRPLRDFKGVNGGAREGERERERKRCARYGRTRSDSRECPLYKSLKGWPRKFASGARQRPRPATCRVSKMSGCISASAASCCSFARNVTRAEITSRRGGGGGGRCSRNFRWIEPRS